MKKEKKLVGLLALGAGAYLLLNHWHILTGQIWLEWPALLVIFGGVLLIFGWATKESDLLFPGFLLFGLGVHAFYPHHGPWWAKNATFYPLLIGCGFVIRYYKVKKSGLFTGLILILFAFYPLFSQTLDTKLHHYLGTLGDYWPILLVIIGLFLFFRKK